MNLEHAKRWADALGSDTDALAELYADDGEFTLEYTIVDDHMDDTITTRDMLRRALGGLANDDPENGAGVHSFEATEYIGDERYGLIHWNYSVEHAATFRGIPTAGKRLETKGSTFHQFDRDGKIVLESTCWNDNPIFQQLGIPVLTPHYWEEGFDPASLGA
jgi:steroid delta-isomerase-like uncharacterized protein